MTRSPHPHLFTGSSLAALRLPLLFTLLLALTPRPAPALVISEVMYNPDEAPDERPFEYLELYNENCDPLDLSGYTICNGVDFTVPPSTWIDGRSFLVICANEDNIRSKYGITNTVGDWFIDPVNSASLSNGGERVEVCNPGGRTVVEVRFNDRGKWPSGADGTGHSLELLDPFIEVDDPDSWALSNTKGGSPGIRNPCWTLENPPAPGVGGAVGIFKNHGDVGFPCTPGSSSFASGTGRYTITGSGNDIWAGGDQFQFAYVRVQGNFDIRARFASRTWGPAQWGKGGLMARQDLTPNARYAFVHDSPNPDSSRMAMRPTHGGGDNREPYVLAGGTHVTWLRLARSGDTITGYHSANGTTWTEFGAFPGPAGPWGGGNVVYLGLALTSHSNCDTATLVFDQVTLTGTTLPPDTAPAGPCPGAGPEPPACAPRVPVRLNEAYLRVNGGEERWIELYNPGASPVSLAGYYLTNDAADLNRFQIPGGTTLASKGFLALTESDLGFSLAPAEPGEIGDRIFIALAEPLPSNRVVDAFNFEPVHTGYSEARIGGDDLAFTTAADPTFEAANRVSATTDIVIHEVMYHSIDDDRRKEWVELYNKGPVALDLTGYALSDGLNFAMPGGTVIPAGGYLVIARDPPLIRNIYGLGDEVMGPDGSPEALALFGVLRDDGERLTLSDPLGRTVDTIRYHDGGEWPRWPDGHGSSLELIDVRQDNRRGQAWDASDDAAKATAQSYSYSARHGSRDSELAIALLSRGIAVVDDLSVRGGGVTVNDTPLIEANETWRYLKGTDPQPATWMNSGFNDVGWASGGTGIGYGDGDDATMLLDMQQIADNPDTPEDESQPGYMTVFCRKTFNVPDRTAINQLILTLTVDDGFYAYLNGTLVASNNVTTPDFDAAAPAAPGEPILPAEYDLTAFKNVLVNGANVLAVQVHNAGLGSTDLSFIPRLVNRTTTPGGGTEALANGNFNANTAGWALEGTHVRSGRTTQNPITGAGSLKVVASGRGDNKVNRIETPNAGGTGMTAMAANQDVLISLKARWVVGSQTILTNGFDHEMARAHALDVPDDLGTPGAPNSVTARQGGGNLGPVLSGVTQEPAVPGAGEQVIVRARVTDPDGIGSVQLRYALNNPSATPAAVAMTLLADDIYQAAIPGQALGTKVVYFITATDAGARPARYPVDIAARTHPLLLNPSAPGLNDHRYCIYRHDVKLPATNYQNYRFVMTDANETALDARARLSNDLVDGSFVFGGSTIYYESSMRFAGSPWARAKWGSARVVPPRDEPLHGRLARIHLEDHHGNGLDARERVSHYLIRQMNQGSLSVPYSDLFVLARWQVNGRGATPREHVWVPDNDFLQVWFPGDDEGDFLEMDDRFLIGDGGDPGRVHSEDGRVIYPPPYNGVPGTSPAVNDGNGQNKENYRWFFNLRAKNGADDYGNFVNFARVMDPGDTSNAAFDDRIWDVANAEEFLRIWAVEFNISDWDTWGAERGKNCYLYRPEATGQWHLLAWDLELTYETGRLDQFLIPAAPADAFNPGGFAEVNRLLNRPKLKRMYYSILDEMVNGPGRWFHSSFLSAYMSRLSPLGMGNVGIGQAGGYVDQRASRIQTRIQTVVYPQVRLAITAPTSAATYTTNQASINVSGTAPAEICEILVDKGGETETYPVVYSSMTNWSISGIPLAPGLNPFTFIGFDLRGNAIDSDTLAVTSTTSWNAPAISSLVPDNALAGADIEVFGSDFHDGVRVFFGATQSPNVIFREADPPPQKIIARVPAGSGTVNVTARNVDIRTSNAVPFTYIVPPSQFIRGDANGDGVVSISDGVKVLRHLFASVTTDCQDALDADDNESLNVTDAIRILDYLFQGGLQPAAPFPSAGLDPDGTTLGCTR